MVPTCKFTLSDVDQALKRTDCVEEAFLWNEISQCCASGILEELRDLEHKGADLRHQDPETGRSALMIASSTGNVDIVKFLLLHGVPWNAVDKEGKTAGHNCTEAVSPGQKDNCQEAQLLAVLDQTLLFPLFLTMKLIHVAQGNAIGQVCSHHAG
jgi:ankyrin repeat protein